MSGLKNGRRQGEGAYNAGREVKVLGKPLRGREWNEERRVLFC
jgi:hypothetical protein